MKLAYKYSSKNSDWTKSKKIYNNVNHLLNQIFFGKEAEKHNVELHAQIHDMLCPLNLYSQDSLIVCWRKWLNSQVQCLTNSLRPVLKDGPQN